MNILNVNPSSCTRWHYSDRSLFEFGDIVELAEDIKRNGQIEPVIIRKYTSNNEYQYEIIAGSRRWKACLDAGLQLNAILIDASDEEAAIIQIKENQSLTICDYSKGIYYAKLIKDQKISQEKLAKNLGYSRKKLQNFLSFNKVPEIIWDAIGNMSKISSRTAFTMYCISQRGKKYINLLIELAEEIKKGLGAVRLENLITQMLIGENSELLKENTVILPSGAIIGKWKNNTLKFSKNLNINQEKFIEHLVNFF